MNPMCMKCGTEMYLLEEKWNYSITIKGGEACEEEYTTPVYKCPKCEETEEF